VVPSALCIEVKPALVEVYADSSGCAYNLVDECVTGTHDCSPHALCQDTYSSYTCKCLPGFVGSGKMCADIDECRQDSVICGPQALCFNTLGTYVPRRTLSCSVWCVHHMPARFLQLSSWCCLCCRVHFMCPRVLWKTYHCGRLYFLPTRSDLTPWKLDFCKLLLRIRLRASPRVVQRFLHLVLFKLVVKVCGPRKSRRILQSNLRKDWASAIAT
jgi:hypothetical protein